MFKQIYKYSLLSLAVLIPSPFYLADLAVTILLGIGWIGDKKYKNLENNWKKAYLILPILYYLYTISALLYARNTSEAVSSLSMDLPWVLLPVLILGAKIDPLLLKRCCRSFVFSLSLFLFICIVYGLFDLLILGRKEVRMNDGFYPRMFSYGLTNFYKDWHPTYVSVFANLGLILILEDLSMVVGRDRWQKGLRLFLCLLFITSILLLQSIAGILILCVLSFLYLLRTLRLKKVPIYLQTITLTLLPIVLFLLFYLNPLRLEKIEQIKRTGIDVTDDYHQRNVLSIRIAKWQTYWGIFKDNPVFGTTAADIGDVRKREYLARGYKDLALNDYNAHNQFLEVLATLGVTGFILFLLVWIAPLIKATHMKFYRYFLLIVLTAMLSENLLGRQQGLFFLLFFYALFLHPGWKGDRQESSGSFS